MSKRSLWLLAGLVLVASLIIGPGATASPAKTNAGTVVFIHDQEPPNLQGPWVGNNLYATSLVLNNIWYGCQIRNASAAFVPRLCTAKPQIVKRNPLTVRFTYKKEAKWSDGKPVVAEDYWATWQVFINPKNNPISRTGWEDIKSVTRGNSKTVTVVFKTKYADWESVVSSGPWKYASWQKGVQITVTKNTAFKAGPAMKLDRLVFRYILDTNSRFQAL